MSSPSRQRRPSTDSSLRQRQPFKAALERDAAYFHRAGAKAVIELLEVTHTGMSQDQFDGCLRRQDLSQSIYETAKQAVDEFGVKSTPTFFINGERIHGTQEAHYFATLIEGALRKARQ